MGFGLLFVGYILLYFPVVWLDAAAMIVGAVMICVALGKLKEYEWQFRTAHILSFGAVLLTGVRSASNLAEYMERFQKGGAFGVRLSAFFHSVPGELLMAVQSLYMLCLLVFLLLGMYAIGREVGLLKIQVKSLRNLVLTAVYFLLTLCVQTDLVFGSLTGYFKAPMMLFFIVWIILIALNIYSCYRYITVPQAEEEEEEKHTLLGNVLEKAEEKKRNSPPPSEDEMRRSRMVKKNEKLKSKTNRQNK